MTTIILGLGALAGAAFAGRVALRTMRRMRLSGGAAALSKDGRVFLEGTFLPEMSRKEAAEILSIKESAAEDEVKAAHRKLMILNHPDSGGSTYLSSKINEAKEVLLGRNMPGGRGSSKEE
jgi:DnaJ homolog subfamily C member 19